METVGAYEAKTHLPKLLERVRKGDRITITKHGVPIAVLQPFKPVNMLISNLPFWNNQIQGKK